MNQRTGVAATLSIIAAIGGFVVIFTRHPVWGLLISGVAVLLGIVGLISAASPRVSGGILSIVAIVLGVIAFAFAILGTVGAILF